jgi:hypothetical protein
MFMFCNNTNIIGNLYGWFDENNWNAATNRWKTIPDTIDHQPWYCIRDVSAMFHGTDFVETPFDFSFIPDGNPCKPEGYNRMFQPFRDDDDEGNQMDVDDNNEDGHRMDEDNNGDGHRMDEDNNGDGIPPLYDPYAHGDFNYATK